MLTYLLEVKHQLQKFQIGKNCIFRTSLQISALLQLKTPKEFSFDNNENEFISQNFLIDRFSAGQLLDRDVQSDLVYFKSTFTL